MNRWDSLWYGPVASARPLLWEKLFLALLALDVWTQLLARGARYGAAGFNVAHFAWLDALQPAPGPELYVGLMLIVGWLAAFLAWTGHDRLGLAALCGLYTWGWSMSILDSYQHHYLISLALLCLVFLPRRLPGEIGRDTSAWGFQLLRATAAVVYGFAAVAKLDPEWRSGATLARIDAAGALSAPFEWVGVSGGVPPGLLAHAAIVAESIVALGYVASLVGDRSGARWTSRFSHAAWLVALALHAGFWWMDLRIGWFGAYMALLASVALAPRNLVEGVGHSLALAGSRIGRGLVRRVPIAAWIAGAVGAPLVAGARLDLPGAWVACLLITGGGVALTAAAWGRRADDVARRRGAAATASAIALGVFVAASPMRFEFHQLRARDLARLGDLEAARVSYRTALEYRAPDAHHRSLVHNNLGLLVLNPDEATDHFRRAVALDPAFAPAHANLGARLAATGDAVQARVHLWDAARLRPDAAESWNGLAWLLATHPDARVRDPAQAVRLAERAVRLSPRPRAEILDTLAAAQAAAGQFDRAVATARRALALEPSPGLAAAIGGRLAAFERGEPFRDFSGATPVPDARGDAIH